MTAFLENAAEIFSPRLIVVIVAIILAIVGGWYFSRNTPHGDPEGRMTLYEHLAELRSRVIQAALAIILATVVAWFFRQELYDLLVNPMQAAKAALPEDMNILLNFAGATTPFVLLLKIALFAGLVVASPVWLYQIWAFIMPGLHSNEKMWTKVFVATAAPLFILGVVVAYFVLPRAFTLLLSFTPEQEGEAGNFIPVDDFLNLVLRIFLVFGLGFLLPVFVVLLNMVGVLSTRRMAKWRPGIIFGIFTFAMVATPPDPASMVALGSVMTLLYAAAEVFCRVIERGRRRRMREEDPDLVVFGDD